MLRIDPVSFYKVIAGKEFRSDRSMLIARNVEWHNCKGWLYLWRRDRYIVIAGPQNDEAASEINADQAMTLYDDKATDKTIYRSLAFRTVHPARSRKRVIL